MNSPVLMQRPIIEIPDPHAMTRKAARLEFARIRVSILDESGAELPLDLFDLSATGAYLKTDLLLAPGDPLKLRLEAPFLHRPVVIDAHVVRGELVEHGRGAGMGVTFDPLPDETRLALEKLLTGPSR